jgi:ATP-dependent Lon protease
VASDRVAGERDRAYFQRQAQRALTSAHVDALVANTPLASVVKLLLAGQLAEASKAFTASAEVVQDTAGFAWLKGEWALLEGQYEQAEALFRQALSKRPELGLAWNRLGDLAQMRHDLRGALTLYKKAILHGEEDANALEDLGDIYATLGQTAQAEKAYRRAIAKDPSARANDKLASLTAPPVAASSVAAVGRIGVLAWTPVGGSARPVEAVAVPGRGALRCSGNVGEAITESAAVAFSVIKARSVDLAIDGLVRTFDLHLHFTDTNVTKDGPSAGLALFLAGVSAYTQKALKPGLAATGELTLHGHVGPVGGIHEKLVAAHLAGYRAVVLPKQNLKEARALPVEVTAAIELIFVDNVADAIARALAETPKGTP